MLARCRAALAVLVVFGPACSALGAAERAPIYRMVWNVIPQGSNPDSPAVEPGGEAIRLKLTPPGLFRTDADIKLSTGELLIPTGTQLVKLRSTATLACTFGPMEKAGAESVLFLGSLKRVCLLDSDNDGSFESRFLRVTNGKAYFLLRGTLSARLQPIVPTKLTSIDPTLIENGPRLSVIIAEGSRPDKAITLVADVGNDQWPIPLGFQVRGKGADLPVVFDVYGGRVEIGRASQTSFSVRVLEPFHEEGLDFWD